VKLHVAHKSAASTSLDRSAVYLAPMTLMLVAVLWPVSQTHATTEPPVSRSTTAVLRVSAGAGSPGPGVSTRST